jgi:hypothetical protein
LGVDMAKLRIPVGVAIALFGFAVALQAVAGLPIRLRPAVGGWKRTRNGVCSCPCLIVVSDLS